MTRRYVRPLSSGGLRDATEADYEAAARDLELPDSVHPLVRRAFGRAVRIQRYSWQEPDFSEVSELEALRALEFYLKARYHTLVEDPGRHGLRWVLAQSIRLGWLYDSADLRAARHARLAGIDFLEDLGTDWAEEDIFKNMVDWLGSYRNELAHGSQAHMPGGFVMLRIVRQIILMVSGAPATAP